MNKSNSKMLKIAGGILLSAIGYGLYKFFNKNKIIPEKLNNWLEEYIIQVNLKLKNNPGQELSFDSLASIMNLITEIEDYLFNRDYNEIEKIRISFLNDPAKYEEEVEKVLELHEKTFRKAIEIVENRLNISYSQIQHNFGSISCNKDYLNALENNQKDYENLPHIKKEDLKKAFLFYAEHAIQKEMASKNLLTLPNIKNEFKDIVLDVFILNKYLLKDTLEKEYGINEKYIYQLLRKYDLLKDPEIIELRDVLLNM
jgi:hypothetical protein